MFMHIGLLLTTALASLTGVKPMHHMSSAIKGHKVAGTSKKSSTRSKSKVVLNRASGGLGEGLNVGSAAVTQFSSAARQVASSLQIEKKPFEGYGSTTFRPSRRLMATLAEEAVHSPLASWRMPSPRSMPEVRDPKISAQEPRLPRVFTPTTQVGSVHPPVAGGPVRVKSGTGKALDMARQVKILERSPALFDAVQLSSEEALEQLLHPDLPHITDIQAETLADPLSPENDLAIEAPTSVSSDAGTDPSVVSVAPVVEEEADVVPPPPPAPPLPPVKGAPKVNVSPSPAETTEVDVSEPALAEHASKPSDARSALLEEIRQG
ncbi:MAG: hypothetical protein ACK5O7_00090, partial [Holosporales bacterium]